MSPEPVDVLLLSFNPIVGWRVAAKSLSKYQKLGVVKIGSLKLLRIPMAEFVKPGRFCNPRKLIGV